MGFTASETIERSPAKVWEAITDWPNASKWMNGVEGLRVANGGPVGEGTTLAFTSRGSEHESVVTAWEPEKLLVLRSRQGGMTADYAYRFDACREGTRVTLDARCWGDGVLWRLAAPIIGFLMARADRGQVAAFKRWVEA